MLKAGCERAVTEVLGDRSTIVRAGLIIGPYENIGRLPWWLQRIALGGEVLAAGDPDVPMQLVDARDLAAFMLDAGVSATSGTFNASGPLGNTTMGGWLGDCVEATGVGATLTWVADDFLLERTVEPWTELPLWMPPGQDGDAVWQADTDRTVAAGHAQPAGARDRGGHLGLDAGRRSPAGPAGPRLPRHGRASTRRRSSESSPPGTPAEPGAILGHSSASRVSRSSATASGSTSAAKCPPGRSSGPSTHGQPRRRATRAAES